jgi:hypothetical protein
MVTIERNRTWVDDAFEDIELNVRLRISAEHLWNRNLNDHDRKRLGGDFEEAYKSLGTIGIWAKLRGISRRRAAVEVARKVGFITEETQESLLRAVGETSDDPELTIKKAIATCALVLTERHREAFWRRKKIAIDWAVRGKPWEFLWELSGHAKQGQPLDLFDFEQRVKPGYIAKLKSRLLGLPGFPQALGAHIKPAGRGAVKLDLPPADIRLFKLDSVDILTEYFGR